jgi:acylphosphatase
MIARHILARGVVQGVGFRDFTRRTAEALGVGGWVRNLEDGTVEAWLEGDAAAVDRAIAEIEAGPPHGRVDDLSVSEAATRGLVRFEVRPNASASAYG